MSDVAFGVIQVPGWLLFAYLLMAQCISAVSYALGVKMGTQEPANRITEVGDAFFKGYAGADLVFYVPLLGFGLWAHAMAASWAPVALGATLGITLLLKPGECCDLACFQIGQGSAEILISKRFA